MALGYYFSPCLMLLIHLGFCARTPRMHKCSRQRHLHFCISGEEAEGGVVGVRSKEKISPLPSSLVVTL